MTLSFGTGSARAVESILVEVKQGDAFFIRLNLEKTVQSPSIQFRDRIIPLFRISEGIYGALIGVDLAVHPSQYEIQGVKTSFPEKVSVQVSAAIFGVQKLNLPEDKVQLDDLTLKRAQKEREEILGSMKPVSSEKLWQGEFIRPVEGKSSGRFGERRILNGEPRSPHSGEDIKAPEGTGVVASNSGKIVLVGDYFFTGRSIFIDHGLGCYTMYFHLKDVDVEEGQFVKKGVRIGSVGSTGRATGPHLHWGARINGARVNPLSLLTLKEMTLALAER